MMVMLGVLFAVIVLIVILAMLLRRQLREKYAVFWLVIGTIGLLLALAPSLLDWLADLLGVAVPSNLLFALAIVLLVGVAVHLSWELSTAEEEIRRLAEEQAISRGEIEDLLRRVEHLEGRSDRADPSGPTA